MKLRRRRKRPDLEARARSEIRMQRLVLRVICGEVRATREAITLRDAAETIADVREDLRKMRGELGVGGRRVS